MLLTSILFEGILDENPAGPRGAVGCRRDLERSRGSSKHPPRPMLLSDLEVVCSQMEIVAVESDHHETVARLAERARSSVRVDQRLVVCRIIHPRNTVRVDLLVRVVERALHFGDSGDRRKINYVVELPLLSTRIAELLDVVKAAGAVH